MDDIDMPVLQYLFQIIPARQFEPQPFDQPEAPEMEQRILQLIPKHRLQQQEIPVDDAFDPFLLKESIGRGVLFPQQDNGGDFIPHRIDEVAQRLGVAGQAGTRINE